MKYFVCVLDRIGVGFPTEPVERIIPAERAQTSVYERQGQEVFFSLPALFQLKDAVSVHGLVLKARALPGDDMAIADGTVRTVLLTPRIENELEIPEEDIHRLPQALAGAYTYFKGVYFTPGHLPLPDKGQNMILIFNWGKARQAPGGEWK